MRTGNTACIIWEKCWSLVLQSCYFCRRINNSDLTITTKTDVSYWNLAIYSAVLSRDVTKFAFEFDNIQTSNIFNRFKIRLMF